MLKNLLNKLQGKTWGARCNLCHWSAGREDLTMEQAFHRASMHNSFTPYHAPMSHVKEVHLFHMVVVDKANS